MKQALIHDGILQYIDKGRVNIKKPTVAKWVPVIEGEKPDYDSVTQILKTTKTLTDTAYTISYSIIDKDFEDVLNKNIQQIRNSAFNYVSANYDDIAQKQLNRFGAFGNEAQKAEAKKVSDWIDNITIEAGMRANNAINDSEPQSLDYSQFDISNPFVTVENIMTL
jgi:hypothetical protein